jgi:hypothetical protein
MGAALDELNARVSELKANVAFVVLANQLRPRIGGALNWQAGGEVLDLVKRFMNAKSTRPEGIHGALFVTLIAAFERYLRKLIMHCVDHRVAKAGSYNNLSATLIKRNLVLTGRVLAALDSPRDHMTMDVQALVANLAQCTPGSSTLRLNASAFSATVTGVNPSVIEKALEGVDVTEWWDAVGSSAPLAQLLGTKGARATGDRAKERLTEISRWRNNLAHGGDDEIALSEAQLNDAINFISRFSAALDSAVTKRL